MQAAPDEIVLTTGAQHAILLALSVLARPGDVILTEEFTYPGIKAIARFLNLRLIGVPLDAKGMRADAFEEACIKHRPKALYCMPNVQNPTAIVMPESRRQQIVAVAEKRGVPIVEDDTYGFLAPDAPAPLAARARESSYYITTLSKSVAPAVRIGYLSAPRAALESISNAIMTTTWMASPLTAEIATTWIESGCADSVAYWRRREAKARYTLARRILGAAFAPSIGHETYHFWIRLPEPWRADEFVAQAAARGVIVTPSEAFAIGRGAAPHAVRVCLGATRRRDTLERGISILAELLKGSPRLTAASL